MSWALWCGWCWLALFLYQSPAPYFSGKNSILHQESDSTNVNLFIFRINYSAELRAHKLNMIAKRQMQSYLAYAIAATILTCIICLVIFVLRKRIRLVIQLFKEAGKALIDMPLLLVEPILVSIIGPYIFTSTQTIWNVCFISRVDIYRTGYGGVILAVLCHLDWKRWHFDGRK